MFRKVHLWLTLLCAGITTVIMIIMSLCYLYVSEQGLYKLQFQSFKNDMNTITTNLEQQSVISMEWLSKMETQGNYLLFVLDNGVPFLYNQLNDPDGAYAKSLLLEEALEAYHNTILEEDSNKTDSLYLSYHSEYKFASASTNTNYFGSVISIGRTSSSLQIIVLSSLTSLEKQVKDQRYHFILIDGAAILLLTAFSWIFTGKLLKPIMENQQKQIQFTASASHELRTPLAVILSAAECCKTAPPDKQKTFLRTIRLEGLRMSALINDMLTLSQSDNHQFSIQKKFFELDTLLMNSYEAFQSLAKEKSISLFINLPEDALPLCFADPERISQVISILLHNAISYTPEQGKVCLSLSYDKDHFYISVKDNGIGITEEDKKKIFDRFYRTEKSRSTKGHFGLGLSIAYEIIKSHNGSIQVTDSESGGSNFTAVLPLTKKGEN
ncbi:MAG: HAMP domain-containing histidine kinase [Lachnospiraceae bacterium]|nr:HAMP domain-containing histidine kinase [Lachnospiraceae bacterium]